MVVYRKAQDTSIQQTVDSLCLGRLVVNRGQILLSISRRVCNSQNIILDRTGTQMVQDHMTRNRQHRSIVRNGRHIRRIDRDDT